jgi:integrase/recombinase XerD
MSSKKVHYDACPLGHAKLETTALYTRVAVNTIRDIKSPLERLGVNLASRSPPA